MTIDKLFQFSTQNNHHENIQFYNGYCYHHRAGNETILKCHENKIKKCPAYGRIDALSNNIILLKGHNHAQNHNLKPIFDFKLELFKNVISSCQFLRNIYDEISVKHPHAAAFVPFHRIEATMQKWRRNIYPPMPKSLGEYVLRMQIDRWQHLYRSNPSNLTVANVYGVDGSIATVFIDPDILRNIRETNLYIDATYKVCPKKPSNIYQFLTIMVSLNDVVLPVCWSLMSRKTFECYVAVFQRFKRFTMHITILTYMTDFEIGLRNALKDCFPNTIGYGCYFHFVQALRRKARSLQLTNKLQSWEDGKSFFRKLIALAFLPPEDIEAAFQWLLQIYSPFLPVFAEFLQYFQSFWLHIIKPSNFSIYRVIHRTNNYAEAYHRQLNSRFGLHPSIWKFTEHLKNLHEVTKIEFNSLMISQSIRRETREDISLKSAIIEKAWEFYDANIYDIAHFLEFFNHIIPALNNNHIIENIDDMHQFATIPIYRYIAISESQYLTIEINEANNLKYIFMVEEN